MKDIYCLFNFLIGGLSKIFSCVSSGDVLRLLARVEVTTFFREPVFKRFEGPD